MIVLVYVVWTLGAVSIVSCSAYACYRHPRLARFLARSMPGYWLRSMPTSIRNDNEVRHE